MSPARFNTPLQCERSSPFSLTKCKDWADHVSGKSCLLKPPLLDGKIDSIYPLKVNNRNTRIRLKLTIKTPKRRHQADVKKNVSDLAGWKKRTHPGGRKIIFCQNLQFRYFLKQPCSFAYCSSFHLLTFFFILLHRNFNVTPQIFILSIILKHTLKISYPQSTASKSYVFYELEQINNFFSSLFTNFKL